MVSVKHYIKRSYHVVVQADNPITIGPFNSTEYFCCLSAKDFGRQLIVVESLNQSAMLSSPSLDNTINRLMQPGRSVLLLVIKQNNAIGRNNRIWTESSTPGNSLSIVLNARFDKITINKWWKSWPCLQFVGALSIHNFIEHLQNNSKKHNLNVGIKWPNDVFIDRWKVAGILCKNEVNGADIKLKVGIGVNLGKQGLPNEYRSIEDFLNFTPDIAMAAAMIMNRFEYWFNYLCEDMDHLLSEYKRKWIHNDQQVYLPNNELAVICDVDNTGCLIARNKNSGIRVTLSPDCTSITDTTHLIPIYKK
ncbi:hypothetical protein GJ496_010928 [Pomphorhynchus laevis]|nr:hypothetical protein GJ496_010928 [Pomphorhynchus laevis]